MPSETRFPRIVVLLLVISVCCCTAGKPVELGNHAAALVRSAGDDRSTSRQFRFKAAEKKMVKPKKRLEKATRRLAEDKKKTEGKKGATKEKGKFLNAGVSEKKDVKPAFSVLRKPGAATVSKTATEAKKPSSAATLSTAKTSSEPTPVTKKVQSSTEVKKSSSIATATKEVGDSGKVKKPKTTSSATLAKKDETKPISVEKSASAVRSAAVKPTGNTAGKPNNVDRKSSSVAAVIKEVGASGKVKKPVTTSSATLAKKDETKSTLVKKSASTLRSAAEKPTVSIEGKPKDMDAVKKPSRVATATKEIGTSGKTKQLDTASSARKDDVKSISVKKSASASTVKKPRPTGSIAGKPKDMDTEKKSSSAITVTKEVATLGEVKKLDATSSTSSARKDEIKSTSVVKPTLSSMAQKSSSFATVIGTSNEGKKSDTLDSVTSAKKDEIKPTPIEKSVATNAFKDPRSTFGIAGIPKDMDKYKDKMKKKREDLVKKHPMKFQSTKKTLGKEAHSHRTHDGDKDTLTLQKMAQDATRKQALLRVKEKFRKKPSLREDRHIKKTGGVHNRRSRPLKRGERVFNKIPIIKRAYKKTPLEETYSDATLSLVHSLEHGIFNSGPLDFRRKKALRDWLNLLSVTLPPELDLHSLIDDLSSNIDVVSQEKEKLEAMLKKHRIKEKKWSKACKPDRKHRTSGGFYCGFWKLLHIVSVGLAEHRGGLDNGSEVLVSPMKAGDTLREYMAHFFRCETCSRSFIAQYDECKFRRCDRLADYADGLPDEQWKEFPLWLWEVHNDVNVRLFNEFKGRKLIDSDEISVVWPHMEQCFTCISEEGTWNEDILHQHLVQTYWSGPEPDLKDELLRQYERSLERPMSNNLFFVSISLLSFVAWAFKKRYIKSTGLHKKNDGIAVNGKPYAKLQKPGPTRTEELKWRRI